MNNLLLKSYLRCKRKAWLDFKGNKVYKNWSAQKSIQKINEFENFKKITNGDISSGIKACEQGHKGIIGLKLNFNVRQNLKIEVHPSLLIRIKGKSKWGNYKYITAISKSGKRTTKEILLDLALCSLVLEKVQKSNVEDGLVISNFGNKIEIEKICIQDKLKQKAIQVFFELNSSLRQHIPEITDNRKKCSICTWQDFCNKEAKARGFLTDIDGIGTKTSSLIKDIGISNVAELASSNQIQLSNKLSKFQDEYSNKTTRYIYQSKSYISGLPIEIFHKRNSLKTILDPSSGFFIFDIESNPDENHDFLYGFLLVENIFNNRKENQYETILNLENKNSKKYFEKIFSKINSKKNWPILHYGETEKIFIIKLAQKSGLKINEIETLKNRFIDLHLLIKLYWILPLKNYSLKTVANWIGFKWNQKNASGSKALYWWTLYRNTHKNDFLKKIIKYNKDDCEATLAIARWLLENSA